MRISDWSSDVCSSDLFEDPETSDALLRPLAAYNNFAKLFSCQIYSPDHLYWKQDIDLDGGVKLRLNGLTSTLLSGRNGQDDERPHLYLSPLQTVLSPEDDVVNLVIAHHPPDWCKDTDEIEDDMNRSEENTSEIQSLMRISYAVISLK